MFDIQKKTNELPHRKRMGYQKRNYFLSNSPQGAGNKAHKIPNALLIGISSTLLFQFTIASEIIVSLI